MEIMIMSGPSITSYEKYNVPSEKPLDGMLYLHDVLYRLKFSRPTLYREIRSGNFPKPRKWARKSVWFQADVDTYIIKKLNLWA